MKRVTRFSVAVVLGHAVVVDIALFMSFQYWGTSLSVTAGAIQRFFDMPVLRVCEWVLNRPELPVWWASSRHAFLIREMFVFDVIGGLFYGLVIFIVMSIKRRGRNPDLPQNDVPPQ